ncbi:MAG: hypothetical protein HWE25_14340 [Alphaproteobacteria bacterium]|nr:hypothetical protein [Alphaproteobacteria bacterium]
MLALLWITIFGSVGHMTDPDAARGALVGTFLMMQFQRYRMLSLRTSHVLISAFVGGLTLALVGRRIWMFSAADMPGEAVESLLASLLAALLMAASFYFLTLRRGHMP